jgi:Na+/H+-translocating membrane pyrophosphatase
MLEICMEKKKPTYDLDAFKDATSAVEKLNATGSAIIGAASGVRKWSRQYRQ